jgi:hypothetical protein
MSGFRLASLTDRTAPLHMTRREISNMMGRKFSGTSAARVESKNKGYDEELEIKAADRPNGRLLSPWPSFRPLHRCDVLAEVMVSATLFRFSGFGRDYFWAT